MDRASCIIGPGTWQGLFQLVKPGPPGVFSVTRHSIVLSSFNITDKAVRWHEIFSSVPRLSR